jgi:predicted secreted protein
MKQLASSMVLSLLLGGCASPRTWEVTLNENPSTGYSLSWEQKGKGEIKQADEYTSVTTKFLGAPIRHTYEFQGVRKGEVILTFTNSRKWEKTGDKQQYIYKLVVDSRNRITEQK